MCMDAFCSADPMYTLLLLLICYCIEPLISKITILRSHVNLKDVLLTVNLSSYTLLATPANYQASACYVSLQPTLALGGEATSNLCLGILRLALPKGCPERGEETEGRKQH